MASVLLPETAQPDTAAESRALALRTGIAEPAKKPGEDQIELIGFERPQLSNRPYVRIYRSGPGLLSEGRLASDSALPLRGAAKRRFSKA